MKVVIVGGGKVGYYVAKSLIEDGVVDVSLIEKNETSCERIANELDIPIFCDDGTTVEALLSAGTVNADVFIAVTGSDEANIVACEIAKKKFSVDRVISRANNPRNVDAMKMLGADIAVSSTQVITNLIQMEVDSGVKLLATLNSGESGIVEIVAGEFFNHEKAPLSSIPLPRDCIIVAVVSKGTMVIPRGDTIIYPGDHITAVAGRGSTQRALKKLFC